MLNEEQQVKAIDGITGADVVICLQIIQRLVNLGNGAIQDQELQAVGTARTNLVAAMEKATGVNFDLARAAQARALREAQARQAKQAEQAANTPAMPATPAAEAQEDAEVATEAALTEEASVVDAPAAE